MIFRLCVWDERTASPDYKLSQPPHPKCSLSPFSCGGAKGDLVRLPWCMAKRPGRSSFVCHRVVLVLRVALGIDVETDILWRDREKNQGSVCCDATGETRVGCEKHDRTNRSIRWQGRIRAGSAP